MERGGERALTLEPVRGLVREQGLAAGVAGEPAILNAESVELGELLPEHSAERGAGAIEGMRSSERSPENPAPRRGAGPRARRRAAHPAPLAPRSTTAGLPLPAAVRATAAAAPAPAGWCTSAPSSGPGPSVRHVGPRHARCSCAARSQRAVPRPGSRPNAAARRRQPAVGHGGGATPAQQAGPAHARQPAAAGGSPRTHRAIARQRAPARPVPVRRDSARRARISQQRRRCSRTFSVLRVKSRLRVSAPNVHLKLSKPALFGRVVKSHSQIAMLTRLETVAAFLAGHHPGDTGPGGSSKGPCAIAGMFGCAPAAASEEYGSVSVPACSRAAWAGARSLLAVARVLRQQRSSRREPVCGARTMRVAGTQPCAGDGDSSTGSTGAGSGGG